LINAQHAPEAEQTTIAYSHSSQQLI